MDDLKCLDLMQCGADELEMTSSKESLGRSITGTLSGFFASVRRKKNEKICHEPFERKKKEIDDISNETSTDLEKIIDLQESSGAFRFGAVIARLLKRSEAELTQAARDRSFDSKAWLTAVVITYLEQAMPERKDLWELVVTKGRKWLKSNCSKNDLWTEAMDYVKALFSGPIN